MPTSEEAKDWLFEQLEEGNTLAHHGVLGMKWGRRKDRDSIRRQTRSAKKDSRNARDKEILDARARQLRRLASLNNKAAETYVAKTEKGRKAAEKAYEKAQKLLENGKDAELGDKLTHGEKVTTAVLLGAFGALTLGAVGLDIYSSTKR